jgi:hypothetical protein
MANVNRQMAIEDYGLSSARMIQTPLFSGLAAIGGVVLTAMVLIPIAEKPQEISLAQIFSLEQNTFGLITAAVFGLTPRLLIDQLQGQAEQFKVELKKSEATEG